MSGRNGKYAAVDCMTKFIPVWEPKIDRIVASFGMQEHSEDIKQDIYLEMCKRDENGKTGLEKFDPSRGSFSTYVYALILTKVRNARSKRARELALVPFSHDHFPDKDDSQRSAHGKDRTELRGADVSGDMSDQEKVEFKLQIESILTELKRGAVRSYFFRNGECITRDLATLFQMILEGKSRSEIVDYFDYSTGSVGVMFDQLRQVAGVLELRKFARRY